MKKVAIIGHGYVGKQMAHMLARAHDVIAYDTNGDQLLCDWPYSVTTVQENVQGCDLAVVCVPTPMAADGGCNTSIVREVCSWIDAPLVVIKSTVPPGFTQSLNDVDLRRDGYDGSRFHFSPEYAGEPINYVPSRYPNPRESVEHDFCIVGGPRANDVLSFFAACMATSARYVATSSTAAELTKYMENAYFATKIMFCTEFAMLAEQAGVDYMELRSLWLLDSRVDPDHTMVFKDRMGFGGKCLPKDLSAIIHWACAHAHAPMLLRAVRDMNWVVRNDDVIAEAAE